MIRWLRHAIRAEVEPAIRRLAQEPVIQIKGVNIDVCFEGHKKAEAAGLLRGLAPLARRLGGIYLLRVADRLPMQAFYHELFTGFSQLRNYEILPYIHVIECF